MCHTCPQKKFPFEKKRKEESAWFFFLLFLKAKHTSVLVLLWWTSVSSVRLLKGFEGHLERSFFRFVTANETADVHENAAWNSTFLAQFFIAEAFPRKR
jgi:hypothetical protein